MYVIEDELHSETIGTFPTSEQALAELHRLASLPWNEHPNFAPCTNWEKCGRNYELLEYDTTQQPNTLLTRTPALKISATGTLWDSEFEYS